MKKGLFITFEGIDGCGKTTQLNLLAQYLKEKGLDVLITREPGAIGLGEKIRALLLDYDGEVSSNCEAFLFLADRAQHCDVIVKPAVEKGVIVLSDRHTDSTLAYQGYGRGIDLEHLGRQNNIAINGLKPDLTFVFDIDVKTALARVGKKQDRMESAGVEFFEKTAKGYLEIAKQEPQRVKVIDARDSIENIFKQVRNVLNDLI